MAEVPLALRFYAMLLPQIFLAVLAVVTGLVEGVELFPARPPSLVAWFAGVVFLAIALILGAAPLATIGGGAEADLAALRAHQPAGATHVGGACLFPRGSAKNWSGAASCPLCLSPLTGSLAMALALSVLSFALAHAIQGVKSVLAIAGIAAAFHVLVFVSGSLYVGMFVHFLYDVIAGFTYAQFARDLGMLGGGPGREWGQ